MSKLPTQYATWILIAFMSTFAQADSASQIPACTATADSSAGALITAGGAKEPLYSDTNFMRILPGNKGQINCQALFDKMQALEDGKKCKFDWNAFRISFYDNVLKWAPNNSEINDRVQKCFKDLTRIVIAKNPPVAQPPAQSGQNKEDAVAR